MRKSTVAGRSSIKEQSDGLKNSTFNKKNATKGKGTKRSESPRGGGKTNTDKAGGSKSRNSTSVGSKKPKEEAKTAKGGKGGNKKITIKKIDGDVREESSDEDSDGFEASKFDYKRSSAKGSSVMDYIDDSQGDDGEKSDFERGEASISALDNESDKDSFSGSLSKPALNKTADFRDKHKLGLKSPSFSTRTMGNIEGRSDDANSDEVMTPITSNITDPKIYNRSLKDKKNQRSHGMQTDAEMFF